MTAITVFSGLFCDAGSVVQHVVDITGYRLVEDMEIIADAADLSGLDADYLAALFSSDERILESNQADREQIVTWLRYAMVKKLSEEQNLVFWGYTALLLPPDTKNVLSVCLVNERDNRLCAACRGGKCSEGNAQDLIASDDLVRSDWVLAVTDCNDPWCDTLYDLVIPVGSVGIKQSAYLIIGQLANATVQDSEASREYLNDLMLAAEVQAELTRKGYDICVASKKGALTLSFKNHELMLKNATRKLFDSVVGLDGVGE